MRRIGAVYANRFIPGLLDRYLARNRIDAQQTDEPAPGDAPDNLFTPVLGDVGAHGRFDDTARQRSLALQLRMVAGEALTRVRPR